MKKVLACCALGLLALAGGAVAEVGTIDDVPAATLLVPYFEVDLNDGNGVTTLFSINNASASAAVAHVTLWTDLSIPSLDFDVYLTGYDVQTINLRDIFNGFLPITADDPADPGDDISPQGPLSQDINFPGSSGPCVAPYNSPQLDATLITHITELHTGGASPIYGGCGGLAYDDGIARGYVTIDSVSQCSLEFPSAAGYFAAGGLGIANNNNVLWGDMFIVDPTNNFAQGENLVHIEACNGQTDLDCPYGAGDYTFYARYIAASGVDQREPLGMTFAPRYTSGAGFDGTDLLVWRDARDADTTAFACPAAANNPTWFPLNQADVVAFDEEENAEERCFVGSEVSPPTGGQQTCFPAETGRYNVEASAVPFSQSVNPSFDFGWLYLNLAHTAATPAQAWVTQIHSAEGRYSVGYDAVVLQYVPRAYDSLDGGPILSDLLP